MAIYLELVASLVHLEVVLGITLRAYQLSFDKLLEEELIMALLVGLLPLLLNSFAYLSNFLQQGCQ